MIFYGLDMRSRDGSCVGAWDEIYASLYPVMQLDSASLHLAHGLRPIKTAIVKFVCKQPICLYLFWHCSLLRCKLTIPYVHAAVLEYAANPFTQLLLRAALFQNRLQKSTASRAADHPGRQQVLAA